MTAAASLLTAWETPASQKGLRPSPVLAFSLTLSREVHLIADIFPGKYLFHG